MTSPHSLPRILNVLAMTCLAALFLAPATPSQDRHKIAKAKKRAHALAGTAKKLKELGRVDEARKLMSEVHQLKKWLAKATQDQQHGHDDHGALFGHLKHAIHALKEIGREDQARKLAAFTEHLHADLMRRHKERKEHERHEKHEKHEKREEHRKHEEREKHEHGRHSPTEREVARHQVEVMQLASQVLGKAGRGDAAELMGHAAKALALRLEGARSDRARKIMESAPGRDRIASMLGQATEILQDWGQRDRAEMVAKVARQLARRDRERGRQTAAGTEERMGRLAERLERMARELEQLQAQIHRMKRQAR